MTAGISIPLDVKGDAAAAAALKKVEQGVHGIAAAENKAAAAAHARGKAQHDANAHGYRTAHAQGDHGGFMHGLHIAGMAGGELGHLGHRFGRAGHFGAAGLGVAGLGLAASAISESLDAYDERMAEIIKRSAEIALKIHRAGESLGTSALGAADANQWDLRRFGASGGTFEEVKKFSAQGLGVAGLAALRGLRNWEGGAEASVEAGRYGSDPNAIAKMIAQAGGLREGMNPREAARYYASRDQHRRIGPMDVMRAMEGGGEIGARVGQIQGFNNRAAAFAMEGIENGRAGSAAAARMSKAMSPEAAAMTEAWKEATEKSEVLNRIADDQSAILKIWQNLSSAKGSAEVQAIRATKDEAAALNSVNIGSGD